MRPVDTAAAIARVTPTDRNDLFEGSWGLDKATVTAAALELRAVLRGRSIVVVTMATCYSRVGCREVPAWKRQVSPAAGIWKTRLCPTGQSGGHSACLELPRIALWTGGSSIVCTRECPKQRPQYSSSGGELEIAHGSSQMAPASGSLFP